jgi:phospho-N-acetylmuramoyl-pentapeptide-transferase
MEVQIILLFVTAVLTFLLYPFWIRFVYKFHMGEEIREDGPKTHLAKKGTPTMGGLVFILTVAIITIIFNNSRTQTIFPLFVAALAGLFGLIEDFTKVYKTSKLPSFLRKHLSIGTKKPSVLRYINPWYWFKEFWRVVGSKTDSTGLETYEKFLIQAAIGGFVAYWSYVKLGWDYIWFPLLGNVHIGVLYPILIFFLFIGILNFVAFTDGIDGLAGGLGAIALTALWAISALLNYNSLSAFCATFVGALIPFIYFNIPPARIFMGNVGSHVLGATMAVLGVVLHREVALLVVIAVFLADGLSSPLQQLSAKFTGKRLFRMAPIHHHFELLGWPESKVTMRFWLFGVIFAFLGIFIALL